MFLGLGRRLGLGLASTSAPSKLEAEQLMSGMTGSRVIDDASWKDDVGLNSNGPLTTLSISPDSELSDNDKTAS